MEQKRVAEPGNFSHGGRSIRTSELGARGVKQPTLGNMRGAISDPGAFRGRNTGSRYVALSSQWFLGGLAFARILGDVFNLQENLLAAVGLTASYAYVSGQVATFLPPSPVPQFSSCWSGLVPRASTLPTWQRGGSSWKRTTLAIQVWAQACSGALSTPSWFYIKGFGDMLLSSIFTVSCV